MARPIRAGPVCCILLCERGSLCIRIGLTAGCRTAVAASVYLKSPYGRGYWDGHFFCGLSD
eukprot:2530527-Lingulodinium_polyedra.AAC.1